MKLDRDWHRRRRGIAGIVATVFMFAMLFTVGASYFLFVNQNNMLYSQAASARASVSSAQQNEDLVVTVSKNASGYLGFTVQNLGGTTSTVTAFMVTNSNGSVLEFCEPSSERPCPSLPVSVNQGATSPLVSTNVTYSAPNSYTVKAITQLGNDFSATYPPTATTLASQALSSGAIGDLYIQFHTFKWYSVGYCSGNAAPYCLTPEGLGFSISCNAVKEDSSIAAIAYSVTMTDLNSQQDNITLDQYSVLNQFIPPKSTGGGNSPSTAYYIISNSSNVISNTYSPIVLPYDQPKTIVFASGNPDGSANFSPNGPTGSQSVCSNTPSITFSFLVSHGCLALPLTECTQTNNDNYGQVAPYVSTLFY